MKVIKTEAFSLSELKEAIILNGGDYFGLTNAELKSTYIKAKSKISKVILGVYYKYVYTNADKIGSRYYVDNECISPPWKRSAKKQKRVKIY